MRPSIWVVLISFCLLVFSTPSMAEFIELDFTEVDADASGVTAPALRETVIECCKAKTATTSGCKVWERVAALPSDDGNGLDAKTVEGIEIKVKESEMPFWLHCCGSSVSTSGDIGNRGGCYALERP
jgi:hypothetical protein